MHHVSWRYCSWAEQPDRWKKEYTSRIGVKFVSDDYMFRIQRGSRDFVFARGIYEPVSAKLPVVGNIPRQDYIHLCRRD